MFSPDKSVIMLLNLGISYDLLGGLSPSPRAELKGAGCNRQWQVCVCRELSCYSAIPAHNFYTRKPPADINQMRWHKRRSYSAA